MGELSSSFEEIIHRIGMPSLRVPIFYNVPIGIRFEIGGEEEIYVNQETDQAQMLNLEYISAALNRAKTLYENLPHKPDVLRIDLYPDEKSCGQKKVFERLQEIGLPYPHEQKFVLYQLDEEDTVVQLQSYWNLAKLSFSHDALLAEIIRADIGGISELVSSVYFANTYGAILFHLYDDRGADLVAPDTETLRPVFIKFNHWILDYDREQIDKKFAK